jgi:hypothetical protein
MKIKDVVKYLMFGVLIAFAWYITSRVISYYAYESEQLIDDVYMSLPCEEANYVDQMQFTSDAELMELVENGTICRVRETHMWFYSNDDVMQRYCDLCYTKQELMNVWETID